ncbi:hypothetical protein B0J13DRAFT_600446 [Dactylonectria estremocensis]|uniref:MULE transposase domain-containing protein n=1 Tax=Dactylonectria estremocensis TaxID=1079267 RepID=A0A9P9D2R8_9HYPO|nr:hypothetical protein B0J13DRAFT_600446 [Dactylonectria estremocensis]
MPFPMPPPALPPGLPEPREALPVESADGCSDSDDCDDFHGPDDWDGQPWKVVFPSDSPLLTTTYESSDGLFDALKDQKDKAKTRTIKYELVCDKSRYNPREATAKIRNTTTTKLAANCPFKIIVQSLQTNNYEWSMRIVSPLHRDHGRSKNLTEHYHWRKLTEEQMSLLVDLRLDKTISCRSVHKQLCQKWPKIPIRRTDIYNWRWEVNQTKRQGYGPANDFTGLGTNFRFRNAAWGYHKGGKMWQQFSSCLQIDATYSTNCYKMPLVTVVAVSSEKTSMPICYGLLNNEQVASFEWFLKQSPNTQLQLCVFHINSNVVLYIKKWWKKANDSLDSDLDDDQDNADAADVQELERGNTKVKDMKNAKLGPLPKRVLNTRTDQLDEIHRLMESSEVSKEMLPPCTGSTKTQYGLPCAHRLLELALQDEPLKKEDLDSFWHIKRSRDIDDPLLQIKRPPMGIPKGRPRNSEPFGNERAIPEQEFAPQGSTRSGVQRSARRNYSQFELGPTLDEEDAADLHDQQPRRKRRKVAVSVTTQAARQQAKRQEDTNKPAERHIALQVEENPEITESSPAKETGKEKVGDSCQILG